MGPSGLTSGRRGGLVRGFKDAGNGLFASTNFQKGRVISKYEGKRLHSELEAARCDDQTYLLHMSTDQHKMLGTHFYVDGEQNATRKRGGAQFANHHRHGGNNAKLCLHSAWPHIEATKDIKAGEEIFVNCGNGPMEVMLGIKRKSVYTDLDGRTSICTIAVEDEASEEHLAWDMGGTMRMLAVLHYHGLLIPPPDVITDTDIPLWCALLMALAKNPLRQKCLLVEYHAHSNLPRELCQKHVIAVFSLPLTNEESALQREYHVRFSNFKHNRERIVETFKLHLLTERKIYSVNTTNTSFFKQATAHVISLFDGIPDTPPVDVDGTITCSAFLPYGRDILSKLKIITGPNANYGAKQLTRSMISRFAPPSADITLRELCEIYPDQKRLLLQFASHFGDPSTSMTAQQLADKATMLHPLPNGTEWQMPGWDLCCYLCQLAKINPQHATTTKVVALGEVTRKHADEHNGIFLSPSQYRYHLV